MTSRWQKFWTNKPVSVLIMTLGLCIVIIGLYISVLGFSTLICLSVFLVGTAFIYIPVIKLFKVISELTRTNRALRSITYNDTQTPRASMDTWVDDDDIDGDGIGGDSLRRQGIID